jgi:hypothetical protein
MSDPELDRPDEPETPVVPIPDGSHALDDDVDVEEDREWDGGNIDLGNGVNVDDRVEEDRVVGNPDDFESDVNDQVDP